MPALVGEPWRGACVAGVFATALPNNRTAAWLSYDVNAAEPTGDQATWEANAGATLTLRFRWRIDGNNLQQAPNFATARVHLPGGLQVGADWAIPFPAEDVEVTRTFHFDDDPLNAVLGAIRTGSLELYLLFGSNGGATPWNVDSRGASVGILAANDESFARGYTRARALISSHGISNVALVGAEPSSWAFPDPIFTRVTTSAVAYRAPTTTTHWTRGGGGVSERSEALTNTAAAKDTSWMGSIGTNRRVGNGMFLGLELKDLAIAFTAASLFGTEADREFVFAATGHEAGWTISADFLTATRINRMTVDPRISVAPHLLQIDSATFQTPPTAGDAPDHDRLASQLGFAAARFRNARSDGINSGATIPPGSAVGTFTVTDRLQDVAGLASPNDLTGLLTATRGGEAG
ncbi:MAG: hypothetical protein ACREJP_06160, partial [Candidatus Methylomirabilales bacterium]